MTADEARTEYISKMGSDLGEVYPHLWQEVASVHQKWDEYVELFGTKPTRIDLMKRTAVDKDAPRAQLHKRDDVLARLRLAGRHRKSVLGYGARLS